MSVPEHLAELHECFQLLTQGDALQLVSCISRRSNPGDVCAVFLDDDRRIVELFVTENVDSVDDFLPNFVHVTCSPDETWVTGLMLVSDRTGQVPLDKPGDELRWQELVGNAAEGGVTLYDWFIVADRRWAYSLPQFAPTPPQWIAGDGSAGDPRRRVSHGEIVNWAYFASLAYEWPDEYDGIECAALDTSDANDRRTGIAAAHAALYEELRTAGADPADVLEPRLHLHQLLHETVAAQLIDDDPPAARTTAVRLLDDGYAMHEVLHMLCYAALEHVSTAASNDGLSDDDVYAEELDRLPGSWLEFAADLTADGHE